MPYIRVINTDLNTTIRAESNWLYATLEGFNRKAVEVLNWKEPVPIIDSNGYGIFVQNAGNYTFFRKLKSTSKTYFQNHTVDCTVSSQIIFALGQVMPATDGFNFKVAVQLIELGGNLLENIEYGYALNPIESITNWQSLNTFNLINEGVYFFDVRVKNQTVQVGYKTIELYLNQDNVNIGGGDESDNPMPGTGSSED